MPEPKVTVERPNAGDIITPEAKAVLDAAEREELATLRSLKAEQEKQAATKLAKDKAAAEKQAKDAGQYKELHEAATKERDELKARLATYEEREAKDLADLSRANKLALAALPEDVRALAPADTDARALAAWLDKAKPLVAASEDAAAGGIRKPARTGAEPHPDAVRKAQERGQDPVSTHNAMVAAGLLPKDVKAIAVA